MAKSDKRKKSTIADIDNEVKALKSDTEQSFITKEPVSITGETGTAGTGGIGRMLFWILLNIFTLGLPLLFSFINKRLRLRITTKTTILFTFLFIIVYAVFSAVMITTVSVNSVNEAVERAQPFFDEESNYTAPEDSRKDYKYMLFEGGSMVSTSVKNENADYYVEVYYNLVGARNLKDAKKINDYIFAKHQKEIGGKQYTMAVALDASQISAFSRRLTTLSLLLFPLFLVIFIVLGAVAGQGMLNPVREMIRSLKGMNAKKLSVRVDVADTQDEFRELAEIINNMLRSLEDSFSQQTAFVGNASHELRTPIAVIQGYSNLLSRWGKEKPEIVDEAIPAIKKEAENMKTLVEKLLFLTKLGNRYELNYSQYVLDETIEEIVNETRMIDTQHHIVLRKGKSTEIEADRELIKLTLRIFMDNAIKYTPHGKSIEIGCSIIDGNVSILVKDYGQGIDEADLPHIFERFYRCDKARGRQEGSTGLGLSIAKQIVDLHNGEIIVSSKKGIGTQFLIELPQRFGQTLKED